jgi:small neutral amino acid transporter SnatA (MarC family)
VDSPDLWHQPDSLQNCQGNFIVWYWHRNGVCENVTDKTYCHGGYESRGTDKVSIISLAITMIAGPEAITTTIVHMNEVIVITPCTIGMVCILDSAIHCHNILYDAEFRLHNEQGWTAGIPGDKSTWGILLIAIAVQFVINGIKAAIPCLAEDKDG